MTIPPGAPPIKEATLPELLTSTYVLLPLGMLLLGTGLFWNGLMLVPYGLVGLWLTKRATGSYYRYITTNTMILFWWLVVITARITLQPDVPQVVRRLDHWANPPQTDTGPERV